MATINCSPEVRRFIGQFLTGNSEADAQHLARKFRMVGLTLAQWREAVQQAETEQQNAWIAMQDIEEGRRLYLANRP